MPPTTNAESYGRTLKELRDRRVKTQEEVANAVGVKRPTIAQWEKGRHLPSPERSQMLDEFLEAGGALRREPGRSEQHGPEDSLLTLFRRVEAALGRYLQRDADGGPLGWCHNLQRASRPTPVATAFGIKAILLIEDAYKADLGPLGRRLVDTANPDGGWGAGTQIASRPEATAVVIDALVRIDPTADVARPLDLLEATLDDAAVERPFILTTVLETLLDLRTKTPFATQVTRHILDSRRAYGESASMLWCQKTEKDLAKPEPSVLHTARAVAVLARAKTLDAVDTELAGEVDDALGTAVEWLLTQPDLDNTSEQIERSIEDRPEPLYIRHFTSSWVVRALLLAEQRASHPTILSALDWMRSVYVEEQSLWRWRNGDLPVWMTFDAIAALRLAALASFSH